MKRVKVSNKIEVGDCDRESEGGNKNLKQNVSVT